MTDSTAFDIEVASDAYGRRRIAVLKREAAPGDRRPGIVWLSGFKSEMTSTKASEIERYAMEHDLDCLRFDYSGHGQSGGEFKEGCIGAWREEMLAVLDSHARGPQVLIGSSMGGWLALLAAQEAMQRSAHKAGRQPNHGWSLAGLVLIAPAWDMTERLMREKFDEAALAAIERDGIWHWPSAYDDEPYAITRKLLMDGRSWLIGGEPFDPGCPVRIIQGARDPDVPWQGSMTLMELLTSDDVRVSLIKDGEHRLSRPGDLDLLKATITEVLGHRSAG